MRRSVNGWVGVLMLGMLSMGMLGAGCSVVLSTEADCDLVANCGAYVCDDENVACRSSCNLDAHCAAGFGCDFERSECVDTGCRAASGVVELPIDGVYQGFGVAAGGEQVILGLERRGSFDIQRFVLGRSTRPDGSRGTGGLSQPGAGSEEGSGEGPRQLSDSLVGSSPQRSVVAYSDGQFSGLEDSRFHFVWRGEVDRESGPRRWRIGTRTIIFSEDDTGTLRGSFTADTQVASVSSNQEVQVLRLLPRVGGFAVGWVQSAGTAGASLRLSLRDGRGGPVGPELLVSRTDSASISGFDQVIVEDRMVLAWVEESTVGREIRTLSMAAEGDPARGAPLDEPFELADGDGVVLSSFETLERSVTNLVAASTGRQAAVVWREAVGGDDLFRIRLQWMDENGRVPAGLDAPIEVDPGFQHHAGGGNRLVAAARAQDMALVFPAIRAARNDAARNDLWFTRFSGQSQVGVPIAVTDAGLSSGLPPRDIGVVPYASGYIVFWAEESDSGSVFRARSFECR